MISPCRQICSLDENEVCVGCGRTIDEIARWTSMTDEERMAVMLRLGSRPSAGEEPAEEITAKKL